MAKKSAGEGTLTEKNLINRIAIIRAMSEILQDTPLDKVSIEEICKKANLSKATFYRQFTSKYDATQWLLEVYSNAGIDEIGRSLTWGEGLYRTTHGLGKHANLLCAMNQTRQLFELPREYTVVRRSEIIESTVVNWHHLEFTPLLSFQTSAWSKLSSRLASEWHQGYLHYKESDYLELLESVVPRELHDILNEPIFPEKDGMPDPGNLDNAPFDADYLHRKRVTLMAKAMLDTIA